ncbi:MAG: exo-alpha-sialidase [Alphaproteobacteria bacterium]|nr:exo-alpha-sialidase [Alphaproteobacteria bacterium]
MSKRILVSIRKGLFTVERCGSGSWRIVNADFLGDNVSLAIACRRSGSRYAALDHGHFGVKMHRWDDDVWSEIATPAYPPKPEGLEELDMWGRPIPWSTVRIWALTQGGADQPGVLWCGTLPGGVFRSNDHGNSWLMCRSLWDHPKRTQWTGGGADLPGVHSICVDPRNSNHVSIAISTGGIWFTGVGGDNWRLHGEGMRAEYVPPDLAHDPLSQDVHCLAQCQAQPDVMWVQHHNGIFLSHDGGRNFKEITEVKPSAFGFPVVVHPLDGNTAWFVPEIKDERRIPVGGRLCVTRTRDGGKTFETLTRGLPQEHAYDIVYRHAFDISSSGEWLVMGLTTGGLWISENEGDDWIEVTHTLPPVYATRFA